jgi:hypothetical protein
VAISLEKLIVPGTWRYLGELHSKLPIEGIPIGGRSAKEIQTTAGGICLRIGRTHVRNAFVLALKDGRRLLYVRPQWSGYAKVAERVFCSPASFKPDFDHALAKKIAEGAGYNYVLMLRVAPRINRAHGTYEKLPSALSVTDPIAFVDRRVLDKWLGRHPTLFPGRHLKISYTPGAVPNVGFTLQQLGRLAYALGWGETPNNEPLSRFDPT